MLSSLPANGVRLRVGLSVCSTNGGVQKLFETILFAIPAVNTEIIHFSLKQMQKRCKNAAKERQKKRQKEKLFPILLLDPLGMSSI